ncbi:hypothetical protein L5G28_10070 [Gordonia sp. HY285]|uniref:hypothetical protein n=1 Tax=Gordonia liuliyuniae TaxID=2911517 RepID=UPI001F1C6CE4|nr:hypothetical protein [Gordonia liuliyuniae]MCF8610496.1 hypothetical protein [Gordonia liuliyuniae]
MDSNCPEPGPIMRNNYDGDGFRIVTYYKVDGSANAHVEEIEFDNNGIAVAAEFYFDYTKTREVMGRYGIFGVTRSLFELLVVKGFTGFHAGRVKSMTWPYVDHSDYIQLPDIILLIVTGSPMVDDIALNARQELVVSDRVYEIIEARDPGIAATASELDSSGRSIDSLM